MEVGLNNLIKKIASQLFIKYESEERRKIVRSIANILNRLEDYFDAEMDEAIVFGSFSRDTILPRKYDMNSDIDILVQFNTTDFDKLKPESYRNQLKKFAETNYPYSSVVKDHPSVVLELNHIKFDLVPAIFDEGLIYDSIEISGKNGNWMETAPGRFNKQLTAANKKHQSIVKPIIRLIKFWNASNEYPYGSYELEEAIAEMDLDNDNYESGFIYAVQHLPSDFFTWTEDARIKTLKNNAYKVSEYLESGEVEKAQKFLKKIIPFDEI